MEPVGPRPPDGRDINDWDLRVRRVDAGIRCILDDLGAWSQIPQNRKARYTGMQVWDARVAAALTFKRVMFRHPL